MMKIIKNIMIVSVLIMLQLQSVCASGEELDCVNSDQSRELFVSRNSQLCNAEVKMLDSLHYMKCDRCEFEGMNAAITRRINEVKEQNPRVQKFLLLREEVWQAAEGFLSELDKVFEARKTAFAALPERLRLSSDNDKERNLSQQVFVCESVQNACQVVMRSFGECARVVDAQNEYIKKVRAHPLSSSDLTALGRYQHSIQNPLTDKTWEDCRDMFYDFCEREKTFSDQSALIQSIIAEEQRSALFQNRTVTTYGGGPFISSALLVALLLFILIEPCL